MIESGIFSLKKVLIDGNSYTVLYVSDPDQLSPFNCPIIPARIQYIWRT